MIDDLATLHHGIFRRLEAALDGWFLGLFARFVFAALLLVYFLSSATTKLGEGALGFIHLSAGAYIQIVPSIMEASGYDPSAIAFFPWGLIVHLGTYTEVLLPLLIVVGLFTRLAALGMIGFVAVQTYVDINFHGADATTIGSWFDRTADSAIADQRLLWMMPLVYLVVKGAGGVSIDHLLARRFVDDIEPIPEWQ